VSAFRETAETDGVSHRYLLDLKSRLGRFAEDFGSHSVAAITAKEIDSWLRGLAKRKDSEKKLGAVSRNTFRRRLNTFFNYCKGQGWLKDVPMPEKTRRVKEETAEEVSILTVEELTRLLKAASPETLAYWAIAAFAGVRASELERLQWADVNHDHILIRARDAKTRSRRAVDIEPTLAAWLAVCRRGKGKVAPLGLRGRLLADRGRAGLLKGWKPNCCRHSYGSYYLAKVQDINKTAYQMGNSPAIVEAHYKQVVAPAVAELYWSISH
jgi:integrase